jgi:hypothetical protein
MIVPSELRLQCNLCRHTWIKILDPPSREDEHDPPPPGCPSCGHLSSTLLTNHANTEGKPIQSDLRSRFRDN